MQRAKTACVRDKAGAGQGLSYLRLARQKELRDK